MRVYISGPLQGSSDLASARTLYEGIADIVRDAGMDPYVPHLHTDPEHAAHVSAEEVFHRDLDALLSSQIVIAHVGAPSTGVGAEIALAAHAGLSIIAIARDGERVSRFAEGLIQDAGGAVFTFYDLSNLTGTLALVLERERTVGESIYDRPRRRAAS